MFCKYCGKENNDEAKFCKYCGEKLFVSIEENVEEKGGIKIKCLKCNYIGAAKKGRRLWANILALLCIPFVPIVTVLYFVFSHKWVCPKCDSKSIGEIDQQGNVVIKKGNLFLIIFFIILSIAIIGILASIILVSLNEARERAEDARGLPPSKYPSIPFHSQEEIIVTIVNIFCESTVSEEDSRGGSGTIITEDGLILTNAHIIPQDEDYLYIPEEGCLVILVDPIMGYPEEMFWADPIVIPGLSDYYDLAFMEIYAPYYNEEENVFWGTYPRKFPVYEGPVGCEKEYVKLGEPIRIYGYPELVGDGFSLTITDGVVSNFLEGGLIATSAKISPGNSGGLAVSQDGCTIGVPSMVISDKHERFGVIISNSLIDAFIESYMEMFEDFAY